MQRIRLVILICCSLVVFLPFDVHADDAYTGGLRPTLTFRVPMRDGVHLATDIYLPAPDAAPLPVLLIRTPYNRTRYNNEFGAWAGRWNYAVAVQDVRGKFDSEGKAMAFLDDGWGERQDGVDTIRWLRRQKFCNGKVGTVGASAMGIAQQMLAPAAPEGLACQYILVAAASLYHHAAYPGGVFRKSMNEEWLRGNGYETSLAITRQHPLYDSYWQQLDAVRFAARIKAPAIHYAGWFDCFREGTIAGFEARVKQAEPEVARNQKLLIGPWLHGGPGATTIGDFKLPANARREPPGFSARKWFDYWLKGNASGILSGAAVTYYVMGPLDTPEGPGNVWKTSAKWPPESTNETFYLTSKGVLQIQKSAQTEGGSSFVYDPSNPVPTIGGANLVLKNPGPRDQRPIESRPDVLIFSTDVLTEPKEVTGKVTAKLWLATDVPDTDLSVRLCDVYPDGRSILICDGMRRAALRDGFERLKPLAAGTPACIPVTVGTTSLVFAPGHRIRITVTSSNFPRFEASRNTLSGKGRRTAHHKLLMNAAHPSHVALPIPLSP